MCLSIAEVYKLSTNQTKVTRDPLACWLGQASTKSSSAKLNTEAVRAEISNEPPQGDGLQLVGTNAGRKWCH